MNPEMLGEITLGHTPTMKNPDNTIWRRFLNVPFQPTFLPAGAGTANFSYDNFGFDKGNENGSIEDSIEDL